VKLFPVITYGIVADPAELVLGVKAEKLMFAVKPHSVVGIVVGVVNPVMANPLTCAWKDKIFAKNKAIIPKLLMYIFFIMNDL
jgi:hypothetical protein